MFKNMIKLITPIVVVFAISVSQPANAEFGFNFDTTGGGAVTGAAIAAGAGGIVTGIQAFVEGRNIRCNIGNNLETVRFGESGQVPSLREVHTMWALNLPDNPIQASTITTCSAWRSVCAAIMDTDDCADARIVAHNENGHIREIVNACRWTNGTCIENVPAGIGITSICPIVPSE